MMERGDEGRVRTDDIASGGAGEGEGRGAGAAATGDAGVAQGDRAGGATDGAPAGGAEETTPLLSDEDAGELEGRWRDLQVSFVDEPQRCVQDADALVAEVMQRLADGFAQERKNLEAQWAGGGEASTEDLRIALQRYRSFFNRLLRTT